MACRASAAAAPLVLLGLLLPSAAMQRQLSSRQAAARSGTQRLQQVLRSRTSRLRRALWDELGLEPGQPLTADLADAARALLLREADYLAAEDDHASDLLHGYARSAFAPVAAMDFEPRARPGALAEFAAPAFARRTPSGRRGLQTVQSSETVVQRDERGGLVRTTRRCRGRTCLTKTEEVEPEGPEVFGGIPPADIELDELRRDRRAMQEELEGEEELNEEEEEEEEEGEEEEDEHEEDPEEEQARDMEDLQDAVDDTLEAAADAVGSAVRVAARSMAKDLKQAMKDSGLPPLGSIVGKMLSSTAARDFAARTRSAGNASNGHFNVSITGADLSKALQDLWGSVETAGGPNAIGLFAPGSPLANAESVSRVTKMVNGRLVRQTRRCKQGQCTTTTEEAQAKDELQD